ncbi:hypothetical protein M3Y95_01037700 [Aphelenchoides besseyi]|nr:hypothetical protein M3Y95_01037700 [Aphelenchoides besseyi]
MRLAAPRRVSLPSIGQRHLSPKFCYLQDISESQSSSSSSSTSPKMTIISTRPSSARPYRRRRNRPTTSQLFFDDEDVFDSPTHLRPSSASRSPSPLRSFNVTQKKCVDLGFQRSRPIQRSQKSSRRATCPEIWLSYADDEPMEEHPITAVALRIYGVRNVGKKTLARRMKDHADINSQNLMIDTDEDEDAEVTALNFLCNDEEIEMTITHGKFETQQQDAVKIRMVMYSVDSRDSFVSAAKFLYRFHDQRRFSSPIPTILVANKFDLQRKRKVTALEGKMLAKIYKSSFVETSALLSMNLDELWMETLKKLQKARNASTEPVNQPFVSRVVRQGRRFAKSCEELVQRLAHMS